MNKIDDFKEFKESSKNDREEIGKLVIEKMINVFSYEINEYISSLSAHDKKEICYKTISMCDFINETLYIHLLFSISGNYEINPSTLFNDGKAIKEAIKKFEEKLKSGEIKDA